MRIKQNFLEILGIGLIFSFSLLSILFSLLEREISNVEFKEYISYASFFENRFYDYRSERNRNYKKINSNTVLIKIDDESLQKIGTWPLPRKTWTELIKKLEYYNTKVVAFDILFPEKSLSYSKISPDKVFAQSIKDFKAKKSSVILAYTTQEYKNNKVYKEIPADLYNFVMDSKQSGSVELKKRYVEKHTYPIEELLEAGPDLGYINMLEDSDGVFRNYQLVANLDSLYIPSIALKAYEAHSGVQTKVEINSLGTAVLKFKGNSLELNNNGETKVRWYGSYENFYNIPLWKVLEASTDDKKLNKLFNGKIAFIGSTATGAHDLRNTPIDPKMPGVYAHMNMIHMLSNDFQYLPVQRSVYTTLTILIIAMLVLLVAMYFGNAIVDLISLIAICGLIYYIDSIYFLKEGYELKLSFTYFSLILSYSWLTFSNFNKTNKEKKQIKGAFSRYVAPSIVNDMLSNPDKLKVGGERKNITCLFSDVRDFTSISESLSATELAKCLNRYMGEMTDIVFETNGTLDKYIGDAIVAFWGAPLDLENHEDHALSAAVKMLEVLPSINDEFKKEGYPEFKIGLGLNSGECSVGNMGSDTIFAYTALGDNMNLGARLESLCKHYGAQILISENTFEKIDHSRFTCRPIDNVQVKGKEKGVKVYEVLYSYHPLMMDKYSLKNFSEAYELFENKDFKSAKNILKKIIEAHPNDIVSKLLISRCENYILNPPDSNIDHTLTRMTEK